jgi:P4 family phage/plasmid primase-like protien
VQGRDYSASVDFLKRLFGETLHKVELRLLPNVRGDAYPDYKMISACKDAAAICARHDRPGFATYFGACTRPDASRMGAHDNVAECPALWVDIDCVKEGLSGALVIETLETLPFPPTMIINSGGGIHAYWLLTEAQDARDPQVTDALRQIAHVLAGDLACAEPARIMRLPGTMNSKDATLAINDGEPFVCAVLSDSGKSWHFEELVESFAEMRVLLRGKAKEARPVIETDPFVGYAREVGYEPAIDIDEQLAAMEHGGTGDTSVHRVQLRVSMSMIARGYQDEEIVSTILRATENAAPRDAQWNWAREESKLRGMIASGRRKEIKKPTLSKPETVRPTTNGNAALKLVHDAAPSAKPEKAPREAKNEIAVLGGASIAAWHDRYGPILHSQGGSFMYEDGVWSDWDQSHDQMLRAILQEGCARLNMKPQTSLLNAATRYVMDNPDFLVRNVEFDALAMIVAADGVLDLASMDIGAHSPDHFAKFRIGASLEGSRDCAAFLDFLNNSFSDRGPGEARDIIATLQEWFGAALVAGKPRALRKGLLIHGGSRTGKTQISEILRALLGHGHTTAIKTRDLEKDFGTETLLGKRGWVADDAVGQGETLDAETYKVLVTGEAFSVRRKNRSMVDGFRFGRPVCLTMNNLPKIKDGSDAVYNRSLILPMTNVRDENAPEPAGYDSIAEKIIAEELTGVLWWAIEGWHRLAARGVFAPPACMTEAVKALQEANDDIGTWAAQCAYYDPLYQVAPPDLFASFAGWFFQEKGETKFQWSQNGFSRTLKERMPKIEPGRDGKTRWIRGIRLNEEGLENWTANMERDELRRTKPKSTEVFNVNQERPAQSAEISQKPRF